MGCPAARSYWRSSLSAPVFLAKARGPAGGVLEIADQVKQLHAAQFPAAFQVLEDGFQAAEVKAVLLDGYPARPHPVALQDAQVNEVAGVLHEHNVSRVAERFGDHVEHLLRAVGQDHALGGVGLSGAALAVERLQVAGGEFAQGGVAGGRAVLQGGLAGAGRTQDFFEQTAHFLHRQRFIIGEARGQGNHVGLRQGRGHEPRDGWLFGAASQCG